MIKIKTNFPDAYGPDYDNPSQGASQNNHSNQFYLNDLSRVIGKSKFSYLDLGCAGGQSVVDLYKLGNISCGVEGSNLEKMISESKTRSKPNPRFIGDTNVLLEDVHDNWINYKDICLFKADITKPFELINDDNNIQKFDIITAWDVLEHPKPEDIPNVIQNIKNHLNDDGFFICLINLVNGSNHQCIKPYEWWVDIFRTNGFEDLGFDLTTSPRHTSSPVGPDDVAFMFKLKK